MDPGHADVRIPICEVEYFRRDLGYVSREGLLCPHAPTSASSVLMSVPKLKLLRSSCLMIEIGIERRP
jgi:hypothetical protein